jgi:di/tricarboxylate transporter
VLPRSQRYFIDKADNVGMIEVMVPQESQLIDMTVAEAMELTDAQLTVVGLRRGREPHPPFGLREEILQGGDTLLLAGPWKPLRQLQKGGHDLVALNLPKEFDEVLPAANKAPQAILILILTVTLMATGLIPNVHAALLGAFLMGAFGCIKIDKAYRAIQWKTLIMIVGMMPFALALERTGGVDLAADALVELLGTAHPRVILGVLFAITVMSGLFIVNTANAVLIIPIALAVAHHLGASPYPFAMIVALGASATFMTHISPINILVQSKGNYGFIDFVRIGLPLTLIIGFTSVFLVAWLLPLY